MRERITARIVLFDPAGRVLLMKGAIGLGGEACWFTIGGGAEPGESVREAAAREIAEETGFSDFALGPLIWLREGRLALKGEPVWFKESYFVAHCGGGEPSRDGWKADEVALIDDLRWWTVVDIAASDEQIYPPGFAGLLAPVLAGDYPDPPRQIAWR